MNLNQLATGVISGYVFKAVQFAASIALVPFLLDPAMLGVDDYGRAFALLGAFGMVSIATVGLHTSADRSLARAVSDPSLPAGDGAALLGSAIKIHLLVSLVCLTPIAVYGIEILRWLGIPTTSPYQRALAAAISITLFETALYPVRSPLLARGDLSYVNLIGMIELVGRTAMVFLWFTFGRPSIAAFLGLQAIFVLMRQLAFFFRIAPADRRHLHRAPLSRAFQTIRYAGPVTLSEGSTLLVRNIPVILASRFLGATEAGYVAIVANTLQGYVLQVFLAVFQPLAVPIASRLRLAEVSAPRLRRFLQLEAAYGLAIAAAFGQIIIWVPVAIPLWLGEQYFVIVLATQIMVAGCGIQTSTLIRRSILIGNGALTAALPTIAASALVASALIAFGIASLHSWLGAIAVGTAHYVVSSMLGIDRVFSKLFEGRVARELVPHVASVTAILGASWFIARWSDNASILRMMGLSLVGAICAAAIGFAAIIPWRDAADLARTLYRVRRIDLFE